MPPRFPTGIFVKITLKDVSSTYLVKFTKILYKE